MNVITTLNQTVSDVKEVKLLYIWLNFPKMYYGYMLIKKKIINNNNNKSSCTYLKNYVLSVFSMKVLLILTHFIYCYIKDSN